LLQNCRKLTAVHVANALANEGGIERLNLDYLKEIGVAERLQDWRNTAKGLEMEPRT